MSKRMCKVCLKIKDRIIAEPIRNIRGSYYRDAAGKRWHGLKCPECHIDATRSHQVGDKDQIQAPKRKCRECFGDLPSDRYFKHKGCDTAHYAYSSNGQTPVVWTGEEFGASYCEFGSGF